MWGKRVMRTNETMYISKSYAIDMCSFYHINDIFPSDCAAYADVSCYECNVWKAGYGHQCDNPRIRDDCTACMKTETVVYMGYYKNTPRS